MITSNRPSSAPPPHPGKVLKPRHPTATAKARDQLVAICKHEIDKALVKTKSAADLKAWCEKRIKTLLDEWNEWLLRTKPLSDERQQIRGRISGLREFRDDLKRYRTKG